MVNFGSNWRVIGFLFSCCIFLPISQASYAIYVWRNGWDSSVPGCSNDRAKFLSWDDTSSPCFTHNWNTPGKREWLWSTCQRSGRQIGKLFLYDMDASLTTRNCGNPGMQLIKQTLTEGRTRIPGLQIYALFSDGGDAVPESSHVPHVIWYNANCATGPINRIDGVAVNNENWNKNWNVVQMTTYLNNLNKIRTNANQQLPIGSLKTHFSVGWSWGKDVNNNDIVLQWNGKTQPVMRHFIDIFDQLDVQTAFITADAMESRLRIAEWDYARQQGKPQLVNAYISKTLPCQTTFFPFATNDPDCPAWSYGLKTEAQMFQQLDTLQNGATGAGVVLHHFRGAYSSGGDPSWPKH